MVIFTWITIILIMKQQKLLTITFLITFFSISYSFAQESDYAPSGEYVDGYIVLTSSDTLYGYLKELDIIDSCKKVDFLDKNKEKVKVKPKKIAAYKRGEDLFIRKDEQSGKFQGQTIGLLKVIEDGKVRLYQHTYDMSSSPMPKPGLGIGIKVNNHKTDYYLERYGRLMMVNKLHFKNEMSMYFSDYEEIVKKIVDKELQFKDIIEIVKLYNSAG